MEIKVNPNAKALIFDCDGTLVDTMRQHREAVEELLDELGLFYPKEFFKPHAGVPISIIVEELNAKYNFNIDINKFSKQKDQRAGEKIFLHSKPIEPVVRIVKEYFGKLPMAVASGGTLPNILTALKLAGIEKNFEVILSAEDPVAHKPNPDIFLEAAKRLGVKPMFCQVFEDGDAGILAAQAAGMIITDVRLYL